MVTLHLLEGEQRKFAQLYILDPVEASDQRLQLANNQGCNPDLMNDLSILLNEINPFVAAYKMLHDVEHEAHEAAVENGLEMPQITLAIKHDHNQDQRCYNNPRVSEVAIVFENSDGEPPFK